MQSQLAAPDPGAARRGRLGRLEHFVCSDEDPHEEWV